MFVKSACGGDGVTYFMLLSIMDLFVMEIMEIIKTNDLISIARPLGRSLFAFVYTSHGKSSSILLFAVGRICLSHQEWGWGEYFVLEILFTFTSYNL